MNYTMFIGGGKKAGTSNASLSDFTNKFGDAFFSDTAIIIFDVIDSYNITLSNEKTSYPIESRSSVSDHIFSPDGKFSFTGRVTTHPLNLLTINEWDKDTNEENLIESQRAKKAYEVLVRARNDRNKITLDFEEGFLTDYVITNINMTRDSSFDQLIVSIDLEEMRTVTVGKTVLALNVGDSLKNDVSGNKNKGATSADADGKGKAQEVNTININKRNDALFNERCAQGRTEFCDVGERFKFDANKTN